MADQKITDLATQDPTEIADDDQLVLVDVSDGTMAPSGTTKKLPVASLRPRDESLKTHGAVGDNSTDDTTAIQDAIDVAEAAGAGVFAPPGLYIVSSELVALAPGLRFQGAGNQTARSVLKAAAGSGLNRIMRLGGNYQHISDLGFHGNDTALAGLVCHSAARTLVEHVYVSDTQEFGFLIDQSASTPTGNCNSMAFVKCVATDNNGVGIGMLEGADGNAIDFISVTCTLNDGHGLLGRGLNNRVLGGHFESNGGYGIKIGDAADASFSQGWTILAPWLEANTAGGVLWGKATRCVHHKSGVSGMQGADWASGSGENIELTIDSGSGIGELHLSAGTDGRKIEFMQRGIVVSGGTDTDRDIALVPKGAGGVKLEDSSTVPVWISGTGTPEGVRTARIGSIYMRKDGGAATSFYVKESGTGNTGWVAK